MHSLDDLRLSIANLWDSFGSSDNILLATGINAVFIALGAAVWYLTTGFLAFAGAVFAIISALGILKWVIGL